MKKIGFMMLGMLFFLMGCQKEGTIAPEQAKTWTKEHLWMVRTVEGQPLTRAVAVKDKLWQAGDTIRIKFLPGGSDSPALEAKVRQYAAEWLQYAGLNFEYVDAADSADVKIGFDLDSRYLSWSVIGTDCRLVAQDECSLNFFELGMYGEEFDRAEVLRGFGHVLGLGFEHRSPDSPIVFNSRAETYFKEDCHLTDQDVADLLALYNTDQTNYTDYDENSIMVLDLPRLILTTPHVMISSNLELSEMDKEFIAEVYPFIDGALITMKTMKQNFEMWFEAIGDIQIDWGDGCIETNAFQHTYTNSVKHTIKMWGNVGSIKALGLANCGITYLKVDNCQSLERLTCDNNLLKTLDISNNLLLSDLACFSNPISNLDLSKNTALKVLFTSDLPLKYLDFTHNVNLEILEINDISFDSLYLGNLAKLASLQCQRCSLKNINISKNLDLITFMCNDNQLANIDLSNNIKLQSLYCFNNTLTYLDLDNNTDLISLDCSDNALDSLSVANNLVINYIKIINNPIIYNKVGLGNFIVSLPVREPIVHAGDLYINDNDLAVQILPLLESKNWKVY